MRETGGGEQSTHQQYTFKDLLEGEHGGLEESHDHGVPFGLADLDLEAVLAPSVLAEAHVGAVQQLGLAQPVHVALKILFHLFLLPQLLEVAPRLSLFSLLGELSWGRQRKKQGRSKYIKNPVKIKVFENEKNLQKCFLF